VEKFKKNFKEGLLKKAKVKHETDAEEAIKDAEQFLDVTETYLKKRYSIQPNKSYESFINHTKV